MAFLFAASWCVHVCASLSQSCAAQTMCTEYKSVNKDRNGICWVFEEQFLNSSI